VELLVEVQVPLLLALLLVHLVEVQAVLPVSRQVEIQVNHQVTLLLAPPVSLHLEVSTQVAPLVTVLL
jgi:hypothetical protein